LSELLESTAALIGQMAPHVRGRLTAQLLKNVLAHAKELEESLRYVEAYLESAAESEDDAGLLMSAKPLLGDVRKFLRSNDKAQGAGGGFIAGGSPGAAGSTSGGANG
jgi:hypothetical protein